jgi:hypothetical protein
MMLIVFPFIFDLLNISWSPSSQHFQKIRKEARNGAGADGGSSPIRPMNFKASKPSMSAKSTPRKAKSTPDSSFPTSNGSFPNGIGSFSNGNGSFSINGSFAQGNGYGYGNEEGNDDEEMASPSKRQRTMRFEENGGQSAPVFEADGQSGGKSPINLENGEWVTHPSESWTASKYWNWQ